MQGGSRVSTCAPYVVQRAQLSIVRATDGRGAAAQNAPLSRLNRQRDADEEPIRAPRWLVVRIQL